jgi:hypothetical protein
MATSFHDIQMNGISNLTLLQLDAVPHVEPLQLDRLR